MFDVFRKYIKEKAGISDQEVDAMQQLSVHKKLRKKQFLLQEGDISRHKTFIAKGCLRLYRISQDGTEHILRFGIENWWMSDRESFTTGEPSKSYIDALEDSEVYMWTKQNWDDLVVKIPALSSFEERLLARSFNASQNRIHADISYTTEEKYEYFMRDFPDIFSRVPLHMIASYFGVSRETLSRIRNQFTHK